MTMKGFDIRQMRVSTVGVTMAVQMAALFTPEPWRDLFTAMFDNLRLPERVKSQWKQKKNTYASSHINYSWNSTFCINNKSIGLQVSYHIISRISKTAGNWSGCRLEPRSVVKMKQPGAELAVRVRSDPWEKNHRTGMTVMVQLKLVAWWIHSGFTHWIWWFNGILLGYPVLMTNGLPWYRWPIEIDGLQVYRS